MAVVKALLLAFTAILFSAIVLLLYLTPYTDIILASLLVIAVIAILAYHFSPELIMFADKARRFDDALLSGQLNEMSRKFGIPLPVPAVVDRELPDVYLTGVSKHKMVLVITANLLDRDRILINKAIESEFFSVKNKRILDMAIENVILNPVKKLVDQITNRVFLHDIRADKQVKNNFSIRPATVHDFMDINRLVELYMSDNGITDLSGEISLHNISDLFFKRKTGMVLIVESDKKVKGFIAGYVKPEILGINGRITLLVIDRENRRMGMGNTLMSSYLDIIRSTGCRRCYLEVKCGNSKAISMYKKIGFIESGVIKNYYGMGLDGISMYKEIKQQK
jgi:ribosomal protein S18 acetylase RimI-like enzyme